MTIASPPHSHTPRILSLFPHQPPAPNNALEILRQNVFITCETLRNMPALPKHETGMVHEKNVMTSGRSEGQTCLTCFGGEVKTNQGSASLDWMKRVRVRRLGAKVHGIRDASSNCFSWWYMGISREQKKSNAQQCKLSSSKSKKSNALPVQQIMYNKSYNKSYDKIKYNKSLTKSLPKSTYHSRSQLSFASTTNNTSPTHLTTPHPHPHRSYHQ
jgi:lysine/ornithine N-monooxygenase